MYFIILLETYDEASASPLYCDGASALFYWCESIASAPEPERLPIKPQLSSSAGFGPLSQFIRMLAKFFQFDRSFTSVVPPWKNGRHAFSIGTPPECVSENPRSDCFWVRPPVLAKGSREISLMTAVDPFNHRFAWAAKGFRSSTGLICLKLNNIAIENNPSRMIVSRKNFSSNAFGFKGWCLKLLFF